MVSSGESMCFDFGSKEVEGTSMDPEFADKAFMKAVTDADPEMAKNKKMLMVFGVFKSWQKVSRGESLTMAEKAQQQLFQTALAALKGLRPGCGAYFEAAVGLMKGEVIKTSMPIRVDGSVMGSCCFLHRPPSAAALDKPRLEQVAATVTLACVRAAPGGDDDASDS